ncbi:MAG: hypothetical protein AMS20_08960 [Gemmatimonas sp. SG8_28]|nr:MAG: hypothetical protein AMS20_08960 [Gemmatimonas sp. SG8_28]
MRRRDFISGLGGSVAALSVGGLACTVPRTRALPRYWAWVHGGGNRTGTDWHEAFARLRGAGVHGVLVGGGDLAALADAAHTEGLAFHRWIWTLNRSGDAWVIDNHPEWFTVSREGRSSLEHPPYVGYYRWLCPTRQEVRTYLSEQVAELASDPAIDGVHLDYVRHSDVILPRGLWAKYGLVQDREYPEFDFCYCTACRESFRAQSGIDPSSFLDPSADEAWRRFRWESVTGLVRALAESAHRFETPITAAVFPSPAIARRLVRQAWDEWPLDAFFPMLYHGFYEQDIAWIGQTVREGVIALGGRAPLYAGLYLPDLPPEKLARATEVAVDGGAAGVAAFEMGRLTDEHLQALQTMGEG